MHYLYTSFYTANTEGTPIIRPMWMEFPADTNVFSMGNQFMFGGDMLVAPKIGEPIQLSSVMNGIYNVSVYLPPAADWYFYSTKEFIAGSAETQHIVIGDDAFGQFIRAGAILSILNYEIGRQSILHAINDPLRIEVYPDSSSSASSQLYLDDYESHQYRNGAFTLVEFSYSNNVLSVSKAVEDAAYFKASNKMIDEIVIMNVELCPTQVLNRWLNNTPYPDQGNV